MNYIIRNNRKFYKNKTFENYLTALKYCKTKKRIKGNRFQIIPHKTPYRTRYCTYFTKYWSGY